MQSINLRSTIVGYLKTSEMVYKDYISLICTVKSLPAAGAEKKLYFPSPQYDGGGGGGAGRNLMDRHCCYKHPYR